MEAPTPQQELLLQAHTTLLDILTEGRTAANMNAAFQVITGIRVALGLNDSVFSPDPEIRPNLKDA